MGGSAAGVFARGGGLVDGVFDPMMYAYADPAHVHAATRVFNGGQYSYDANGNMTSRYENGQSYVQTFDAENRLVQVVAGGTQTSTYAYNADGAMVRRVRPDDSSTIYAGLVEYELNAAGSEVSRTSYYNVPGARVVRTGTGAGTVSWVLTDHLGSSSVTTDSNGNPVGELRYEAYGATRWSTGIMPTDKLFTGQRYNSYINLIQMGDRWFDPYLNRWIQPDTIVSGPGKPQKLNRYSYVLNNPVEYVDPTGHIECSDWNDYGQCSEHPAPPAPSPRLPSELPPQTADNPADQAKLNEIVETYNAVVELVGHAFTPYELWALIAQAEFGNLFYSYTKFRQGGVDANAAEYYYFCGTDGCSNSELVVYLSQFQVWWDKSPIDFVGAGAAGYERLLESAFNSTVDPNNPLDYDAPWTYAYTVEGTTEFNKLNKGYPAYNGSWEYYAGSSRSDDVWVAIRYVDGFELRWALIVTPNQKAVFCGGDCLQ